MSPAWTPSQGLDEQIRAWMEAHGWKVTAVNYDFDREILRLAARTARREFPDAADKPGSA